MKIVKLFVVLRYVGGSGREQETRVVSMATARMTSPSADTAGRHLGPQTLGSALSLVLSYLEKKTLEP